MNTIFDIGEKIKLEMTGEIIEYSVSKNGDCYTIELPAPDGKPSRDLRVYLSTENLELANARKVD